MRSKGITYDAGFINGGVRTRETFNPRVVEREMEIIHDDLHCNAVRVTGGDADRLELAATLAAATGLEVWYSPFTCDLTTDELLAFLTDAAERAEQLRGQGAEVVFLTGSELSLFTKGFLPGDTLEERLALLKTPERLREALPKIPALMNAFLTQAVAAVRERFAGNVTYASIPIDGVDWTPFDITSVDSYRSAEIAGMYRNAIHTLVAQGKPVAITEFGSATYHGAADKGGRGAMNVVYEGATPIGLDGDYLRDEAEQATSLRELLDIYTAENVDTIFVNTFASYHLPHRAGARQDLDLASYGVVKVLEGRLGQRYPDMSWEPKVAFATVADYYRAH